MFSLPDPLNQIEDDGEIQHQGHQFDEMKFMDNLDNLQWQEDSGGNDTEKLRPHLIQPQADTLHQVDQCKEPDNDAKFNQNRRNNSCDLYQYLSDDRIARVSMETKDPHMDHFDQILMEQLNHLKGHDEKKRGQENIVGCQKPKAPILRGGLLMGLGFNVRNSDLSLVS